MRIEGSASFPADRERVYRVFTDPGALARATPGIQSLDQVGPGQFAATLKVGVAGINGVFKGTLTLQDQRPPEHYTLAVAGEGAPGFVRGTATFDFAAQDGATVVTYVWDVQVGGLIAGVGQRVLGGVARMLIGQFMAAMARELAGGA